MKLDLFRSKVLATAVLSALAVAAVFGGRLVWGPESPKALQKQAQVRSRGNPAASIWIVEYFDFGCHGCRTASGLLKEYLRKYPDKIYAQTRFYPLIKRVRSYGLKAAIYAECVSRQGKFWPYHDLLLERQEEWSRSDDPDLFFRSYAQEIGTDLERLSVCVDDPAVKDAVLAEKSKAIDLGVSLTPTFFINGKMVVGPEGFEKTMKEYFPEEGGP